MEKKKEGCKVRVIIYANHTNQKHGVDLSPFEHKAIRADRKGIMHHKFCVIDNNITIHGSYNWTTAAETKNNEEISVDKNDVKKPLHILKSLTGFGIKMMYSKLNHKEIMNKDKIIESRNCSCETTLLYEIRPVFK